MGSLAGSAAIKGQAIYGMAKSALHHLVRFAAQEFDGAVLPLDGGISATADLPELDALLGPKGNDDG